MARLPFIVPEEHPELAPIIDRIKGERRGSFLNLYKVFLNSPKLAESWLDFISDIRFASKTSDYLREAIIIQIGYLNDAAYVIRQHVPALALAAGMTVEQCEALQGNWRESPLFDDKTKAALAYSQAMTVDIKVPDDVFDAVARHYDNQEIMDLSLLIGAYNMHTRVLQALDVDLEVAVAKTGA